MNITGKRADGYHDLETVFYPLSFTDALEIIPAEEITFQLSGLPVSGGANDNLCVKAYYLLKNDFPELSAVKIYLHKVIPMGAGLGGGSADGAFMLLLLNKEFKLNLSQHQLMNYALQLGSDCAFFIINTPCFATGRGEILTPVALDLSAYKVVLVNPGVHVSTREAFSKLVPAKPVKSIRQIIAQPVHSWKDELINDFEKSVSEQFPVIKDIKHQLYRVGALYASMTGSGSTVFGIFEKEATLSFSFPANYSLNILS